MLVCAVGFPGRAGPLPDRLRHVATVAARQATWAGVVTGVLGVPPLPALATDGTVGDNASATAAA